MTIALRRNYVVQALQTDESLPFEMESLVELVKADFASWTRHGRWILRQRKIQQSVMSTL
jgi:hypothetical protein